MRNENVLSNGLSVNDAQKRAIMHTDGPAIVLAGPGSGKTKVITERVKYLIEQKDIAPSSILVITFTKAAALEMQHRFFTITDSSYPEVSFGTFHSVFYQIIKNSCSKNDSRIEIANEAFKAEIIKDIVIGCGREAGFPEIVIKGLIEEIPDIISEISRVKNLGIETTECRNLIQSKDLFPRIFKKYSERLKEFGRIDFDDMIFRCYEVLSRDPRALQTYRERFKYILIDEYQDINPMQYKVIRLLGGDTMNIFAVGDDDQSIYGFRGSSPEIMLSFSEEFKDYDPKEIPLTVNYRCNKAILESALKVISLNTKRYIKNLSPSPSNPKGGVHVRRYDTRERQYHAIAQFLKKRGGNLDDVAILFRTNSEAHSLKTVLNQYGIETNLDCAYKKIYTDSAIKLIRDYLSFASLGNKRTDFLRIINKPMRYVSRDCATRDIILESDILKYYAVNRKRSEEIRQFFRDTNMLRGLRPSLSVRYLRKNMGFDKLFAGSVEILNTIEKAAADFADNKSFIVFLDENAKKESETQKSANTRAVRSGKVNILTMHSSKGLEFDCVWLPDLNEGVIPSRNAVTLDQIEEERRMLYVAMTRAKKALIMSYVTGSEKSPMLPTRFIKPIRNLWDEAYRTQK